MAKMYNYLANSSKTRINDMFDRPTDVGYQHMKCDNPDLTSGMRLTFRANEGEDLSYAVSLDPLDVQRVVNRLLNPNYNMGFFADMKPKPDQRSDDHYDDLLLDCGIKLTTWCHPAPSFANGTKRWYFVRAVNRYHAEHQLASILRNGYHPAHVKEWDESMLEQEGSN